MSYNIAIVISPIPSDDAEAWKAVQGLIDAVGETPRIFQELHDKLTEKYPCMCSVPDDEVDDVVWSDGPLINNFGHRVAVIGMSYSRVDEVLPFIISAANGMGLSVFDWGTDIIYRS